MSNLMTVLLVLVVMGIGYFSGKLVEYICFSKKKTKIESIFQKEEVENVVEMAKMISELDDRLNKFLEKYG